MEVITLSDYRLTILKKDGTYKPYPKEIGKMHQDCITEFCKEEGYESASIKTVVQNGNAVFYNANQSMFALFMPKNITEAQYYTLDLQSLYMNDITYMEVRIEEKKDDILINPSEKDSFSKKVLQCYFEEKENHRVL